MYIRQGGVHLDDVGALAAAVFVTVMLRVQSGARVLVPGSYTFATARSSRSLTAQRTLTIN
ncbi:hypothetical protein AB0L35_07965 [Streptomyces sp. NPDC052309]|uniref:hypothetical protein n=1 Tax=Streptomyces sp. NPDC052309 TaxID=3155421 RepID=UPI00342B6EDE